MNAYHLMKSSQQPEGMEYFYPHFTDEQNRGLMRWSNLPKRQSQDQN